MGDGVLSIKLRCASWQQLATIYKRDLSHGTMFLRAPTPPEIGTAVRIDLALPSATVIVLTGVVQSHVSDPQRGTGIELKIAPLPAGSVWLIESALASEHKRLSAQVPGASPGPAVTRTVPRNPAIPAVPAVPAIPAISDSADVTAAEHELIKALMSEVESLKVLNPFLVLGVGYAATDAEVRAAFGELTKRYHPDRFARYESAELRQIATEIFILIRDAYHRLGNAAARAQLLQSLGKPAPAPRAMPGLRATPPLAPPRATSRVPVLAVTVPVAVPTPLGPRIGADPRAAADRRAPAEPSSPPSPLTPTTRRSRTSSPPPPMATPVASEPIDVLPLEDLIDQGRLDEALAAYKVMGKKHPYDRNLRAGVELCEGLRALAARNQLEAAHRFEAALEIDPSNERAARALADMRRQATNERKGLLSRLMGKKEP